jgi:hypothetical protein
MSARPALRTLGGLVLAAAALVGCSSGSDDLDDPRSLDDEVTEAEETATGTEHTVRLLVRDGNLRVEGSDCAGSGGLIYIHPSSPFRIEDGEGTTLDSGELPAGTAVKALDEDFGVAKRIPSFCEFAFPVSVAEAGEYHLVIDGRSPLALTVQEDETEGRLLVALIP